MTEHKQLPPGIREYRSRYQVRYYGSDGKRRAQSFDRLTDAKRFQRATEVDKDRQQWLDPRLGQTAFDKWAQTRLDSKHDLRPSTRATDTSYMRNHVAPGFGGTPLARIRPLEVQEWVNGLAAKGLAPKTVRECYRLMAATMRAAVDARLIVESPCRGINLPRTPRQEQRFLTAEEVESLADSVDAHYRALVLSAVYLGCRWGEFAGLKRKNLDLLRRRVQVVGTLEDIGGRVRYVADTKTKTSRRSLSVPRFLADELATYLGEAPASDFVFVTKRGLPLRRGAFRGSVWLPAIRSAGLAPLRFHDLRHTCAGLLIAEGAHPKEIQARLVHSSITTTLDRYGHLMPSLDDKLTDRLDAARSMARAKANGDQMGTRQGPDVIPLARVSDGAAP